jgi:hypothetical protein
MVPHVNPWATAPHPSMFIGGMEPRNVAPYIRRYHITVKCIVNLSVPTNMLGYVRQPYIRWHVCRLTSLSIVFALPVFPVVMFYYVLGPDENFLFFIEIVNLCQPALGDGSFLFSYSVIPSISCSFIHFFVYM